MSRCCWCSGLKEPGNSNISSSSSSSSSNSSLGKVQEHTSRANGCCAPASGCRTSQFSRQCASCVCKEQPVHGQQPRLPQSKPNLKGKASINRPFEGSVAARHRKQFIAALATLIAQPPPFTIQTNTPTPQHPNTPTPQHPNTPRLSVATHMPPPSPCFNVRFFKSFDHRST